MKYLLLFHSNNGMQTHLNIMFVPPWPVLLTFTEVIRWNMKVISVLCTSVCLKIFVVVRNYVSYFFGIR